jgi:hypothetical protein
MAAFFPNLIFADARARMLANFGYMVPDVLAIGLALLVAAFTLYRDVPLTAA